MFLCNIGLFCKCIWLSCHRYAGCCCGYLGPSFHRNRKLYHDIKGILRWAPDLASFTHAYVSRCLRVFIIDSPQQEKPETFVCHLYICASITSYLKAEARGDGGFPSSHRLITRSLRWGEITREMFKSCSGGVKLWEQPFNQCHLHVKYTCVLGSPPIASCLMKIWRRS